MGNIVPGKEGKRRSALWSWHSLGTGWVLSTKAYREAALLNHPSWGGNHLSTGSHLPSVNIPPAGCPLPTLRNVGRCQLAFTTPRASVDIRDQKSCHSTNDNHREGGNTHCLSDMRTAQAVAKPTLAGKHNRCAVHGRHGRWVGCTFPPGESPDSPPS